MMKIILVYMSLFFSLFCCCAKNELLHTAYIPKTSDWSYLYILYEDRDHGWLVIQKKDNGDIVAQSSRVEFWGGSGSFSFWIKGFEYRMQRLKNGEYQLFSDVFDSRAPVFTKKEYCP